jgi:REP element-mobilizing transposase RayT
MNRGIDHGDVFFDDSDRIEMGQRFADIHDEFGVETHAYCLMGNHFHALLHCPGGGLSASLHPPEPTRARRRR